MHSLPIYFPAFADTHFIYTRKDGQAELI